jgi:hypothetical protein
VPREEIGERVQEALKTLIAAPDRPRLEGRSFPWAGVFSDGRLVEDARLADPRDDAAIQVDFRFLVVDDRAESIWVRKSAESALHDRLVWVCGDTDQVEQHARELERSRAMVRKYRPRRESLVAARKLLLQQEENRTEDLEGGLRVAVAAAWMSGRLYFRGRSLSPQDQGATFAKALLATATRVLPELYPHFVATNVAPGELMQLVEPELLGPSPKFFTGELGILELDSGRYEASCSGVVPRRILEHVEAEQGVSGTALLARFGGLSYGYTPSVVKACVAGLLRGGKLRVQPEGGGEITAVRDAGVHDLFEKDRDFRRASYFPAGEDDVGVPARARICQFFERDLRHPLDRDDNTIADAVAQLFPAQAQRLRTVLTQLDKLPGRRITPAELTKLQDALEQCVRSCRQTKPTVKLVKKHLEPLHDGVTLLNVFEAELTDDAVHSVRDAAAVRDHHLAQLRAVGVIEGASAAAAERIEAQLGLERPWREIGSMAADLATVRDAYAAERARRLQAQEQRVELARGRVKARDGFGTLTADQAHKVLRPLTEVVTSTTAEAVAPALSDLKEPFEAALRRAEDEANERLDGILSEGKRPLIVKVDLALRNREVATEAEVEALVASIRERLLEQVRAGQRVRIV